MEILKHKTAAAKAANVVMYITLAEYLDVFVRRYRTQVLCDAEENHVFLTRNGKAMNPSSQNKGIQSHCTDFCHSVPIPVMQIHCNKIRQAAVTLAFLEGDMHVREDMAVLCAHTRETQGHYYDLSSGRKQAAKAFSFLSKHHRPDEEESNSYVDGTCGTERAATEVPLESGAVGSPVEAPLIPSPIRRMVNQEKNFLVCCCQSQMSKESKELVHFCKDYIEDLFKSRHLGANYTRHLEESGTTGKHLLFPAR